MFASEISAYNKNRQPLDHNERGTKPKSKISMKHILIAGVVVLVGVKMLNGPVNKTATPENAKITKIQPGKKISEESKKQQMEEFFSESKTKKAQQSKDKKENISDVIKKELTVKASKPAESKLVIAKSAKKATPANDQKSAKKTTPTIEQKKIDDKIYLQNRKKILLSSFVKSDVSMRILGDIPIVSIKGTFYQAGESIGKGFKFGKFEAKQGKVERIEDIIMAIPVYDEKTGKPVRKPSLRVGDFYTVHFYEGAIELSEKGTTKSTGIILSGEKVCSLFSLKNTKEKDNVGLYTIKFKNGKTLTQVVPLNEIN